MTKLSGREQLEQALQTIKSEMREEIMQSFRAALDETGPRRVRATPPPRAAIAEPNGNLARRTPDDLTKAVEALHAHVKKNPGQRMAQISKAMGLPTKELKLPMKKLVADKRIKGKGHKASMTYS